MAGKCGDCRFYDGNNCGITKARLTSSSSCGQFVDHTKSPSGSKMCRTCRFYNGQSCVTTGQRLSSTSACAKWAAFR